MAIIPGLFDQMLEEEVDFESGLSEALLRKIAANINAMINVDLVATQEYTGGSGNFVVPTGVEFINVLVCGGGGGGGGGIINPGYVSGGGGGNGAIPHVFVQKVTPGNSIPFSIGAGGAGGSPVTTSGAPAGDGANGGSTFWNNREFFGGLGGLAGRIWTFDGFIGGGPGNTSGNNQEPVFDRYNYQTAGGAGFFPTNPNAGAFVRSDGGENSQYAAGGQGGATTGINDAGGGGAGGAGYGVGGSGGNGQNGGVSPSGGNGSRGGGGGGGGANGNAAGGGRNAGAGGSGGAGYILIAWDKSSFI